ncbi:CRISPR-associated endonuclease Cas1 [Clostridium sp.]|uniref:CRISPR-associated endonuclease Cas1 n=1 Tax=Clostridium sp. TaxID=1506 RepID=UPI003216E7B3
MEGHEGYCARRYFSNLGELIPEKYKFKGRVIKLNNVIQYDCHNIANKILNEVM